MQQDPNINPDQKPKNNNKQGIIVASAVMIFAFVGVPLLRAIQSIHIQDKIYDVIANLISGAKENADNAFSPINDKALDYLHQKYGNMDFTVKKHFKDLRYISWDKSEHVGYVAVVEVPELKERRDELMDGFRVRFSGKTEASAIASDDDFVELYYMEPLKLTPNFAGTKYGGKYSAVVLNENIPNNIGHFPSIDELLELNALRDNTIEVTFSDRENNPVFGDDADGRAQHLKEVIESFLSYYKITHNCTLDVVYAEEEQSTMSYKASITDSVINIKRTANPSEKYDFPRESKN